MQQKKFIPCIYLYQGKALKDFTDKTFISMNPVELAKYYSDNGADALLIFDLSKGDAEHEAALDIIKTICASIELPVIGAGNVHRMEDVKKLLYAGCRQAALNYNMPENVAITEEVSLKFGKEKIVACYNSADAVYGHKELIETYISELILLNKAAIKESYFACSVPTIISLPEVSLDKLFEILGNASVSGITGNAVNDNVKEIPAMKTMCRNNGIAVHMTEPSLSWSDFKLNSDGMLPVVVQDHKTEQVLMVAYMNEEAFQNTIRTGKMTYYSRSRNELWVKGETSGHFQYMKSLTADCDKDTLLAKVSQVGAACHTGSYSCFFNEVVPDEYDDVNPLKVFENVFSVIKDRKVNPKEGSYTNYLFDKGIDKILKKLGEEATEIVIAAKNPNTNEIKYEISDFLYHMMVLMVEKGVTWEEITEELSKR
ncbi:MAG: bifunctional phosphoribosyl-AMP cyclohydrolase/phosphoribosyl-ATP diphosphatase HisIE [Lachnospiraceae bacterium]|nr:bifunctional phosphoribosyl-AMP cyclohydrolase/phosphoribosyl-ATP diphosphatase HisIE [Lachnospiraceae bacterium]